MLCTALETGRSPQKNNQTGLYLNKYPGPSTQSTAHTWSWGGVPWKHPGSGEPGPVPRPSKAKAWLRAMAETQGRSKSPSPIRGVASLAVELRQIWRKEFELSLGKNQNGLLALGVKNKMFQGALRCAAAFLRKVMACGSQSIGLPGSMCVSGVHEELQASTAAAVKSSLTQAPGPPPFLPVGL